MRSRASEDFQDEPVDFGLYFRIVLRRWPIALLTILIIFGLAAVKTLRSPKIYESQAKLVVVTKSPALEGANDSILGGLDALKQGRNVDTQVELIDSADLLEKAFKRKLSSQYLPDGQTDNWSESDLLTGFRSVDAPAWASEIKSRPDTDVVFITTHAYTPKAAAHFANAIANEYEDEDLNRNRQATVKARDWVKDQMKQTNLQLLQASADLAKFQTKTHLIAPNDQASNLVQNSVDIQSQYAIAKGDLNSAKSRVALLSQQVGKVAENIDATTTVSANPEFAQVQAQIVQLEGQLTEQSHEFKPISPEIQQLRHELAEEQDHLRTLSRTLVASTSTEANPVRLKLLGDYADAQSNLVIAQDHSDALKGRFDELTSRLEGLPDQERTYARLELQVQLQKSTYSLLSERSATLSIQVQSTISNVIVAAYARPSVKPSGPKVALNLSMGFLVAVVLGIGLVLVLDKLDTRLRQPDEAETITGLTALSFVPEATSSTGRLILHEAEPSHAFLESFRLLRNNIEFAALGRELKVLAVTSASMSDGKSTNSVNTALAFALDGKKTLIVDLDLRRPTLQKWFRVTNDFGLTTAARGRNSLDASIRPTEWENLSVLTSGPLPPDPTEFLNSASVRDLIREAADQFDLVVLDAPPCAGLSDMQVISKYADGVLVVVSIDVTERPMLLAAMRLLRQAGAPLLGVVVNRMKRSHGGSYGNKGYYGYTDYSKRGDEPRREKVKL